jgi:hypothetical protein
VGSFLYPEAIDLPSITAQGFENGVAPEKEIGHKVFRTEGLLALKAPIR